MRDSVLSDNDRKAELSFAYLSGLAAITGYTCQRGPEPDRGSMDAIVKAGGSMRPQIDVQLKATSSALKHDDGLHFRLGKKNYDDLRATPRMCPIILVVLELPKDPDEWLYCDAEKLIMRRCAWWASLMGWPEIDGESKTIVVPRSQILDPTTMANLMCEARQGRLAGGRVELDDR